MTPALACDPRASVVVEACAGSGKTWLLTARIVRALLEGAEPGGILALTFTNKAAAEMQERVWQALEELSHASDAQARAACSNWGVPPEQMEACVRAAPAAFERLLLSPERPFVGTFHAWYLRLLAAAPIGFARLARLAPAQRPTMLRRDALRRWTQSLSSADRLDFAWLVSELGSDRTIDALWQSVSWQRQVESHDPGGWSRLMPGLTREAALLQNETDTLDWMKASQATAAGLARAFGALGAARQMHAEALLVASQSDACPADLEPIRRALLTDDSNAASGRKRLRLKKNLVRQADRGIWGGQAEDIVAMLEGFAEGLSALGQRQSSRIQQARQHTLMQLSQGLLLAYEAVSVSTDETDFDGIEAAVLHLIRSPEGLAMLARWDCRTEQILVDEFQDTSPAQWALLRAWLEAHVGQDRPQAMAPRVFLVGDPKQSIYQFRGGDPRVFEAARAWLETHFHARVLWADQTRRCGKAVVELLNTVMPSLMNTARASRYRPHQSLQSGPAGAVYHLPLVRRAQAQAQADSPEGADPAEGTEASDRDWLREPRSPVKPSPHREEGRQIAAFLQHMRSQGPQLQWRQMRVLVRSRTHLPFIEQALSEAGVPFVSDRVGGLLEAPEVQDLLALCRLMVYPFSDQDCAHVACSPLLACAPEDLMTLLECARARGQSLLQLLASRDLPAGLVGSWAAACQHLADWKALSAELPIHDFLSRVVDQVSLRDRLQQRRSPVMAEQAWANVLAFLGFSLQWEGGRHPSLSRFVHDLADRLNGDAEEQPALGVPDRQWDAVQLQSLHSAKGLESELVVLACAAAGQPTDRSLRWLAGWSEARDSVSSVTAWLTRDWLSDDQMTQLEAQQAETQDERANLLYVALTRARQIFAVSGVEGDGDWYGAVAEHTQCWEPPHA